MNSSPVAATLLAQMSYAYLTQNTMIYPADWDGAATRGFWRRASGPGQIRLVVIALAQGRSNRRVSHTLHGQ